MSYSGSAGGSVSASAIFEPCGNPGIGQMEGQIHAVLEQSSLVGNITGEGSVTVTLENTLVESLPFESGIGEGLDVFKTVVMREEMGILAISISAPFPLSYVISQVIVATGSQCIYTYDDRVWGDHRSYDVPNENSFRIEVPVEDVWYIDFKKRTRDALPFINLKMEYLEISSSESSMDGVYFNLIVGLVIMILSLYL